MTAKEVTCNRMNVCVHKYLQNTASLCVYMHFYLFVVYLHWLISCSFWFVKNSRTFHSSLHFQVFLYANWSKELTKILKNFNILFEVSTLRESFPFVQHILLSISSKSDTYTSEKCVSTHFVQFYTSYTWPTSYTDSQN